jgi:anti-sigma28 factor (negative regulator of flagellin synthesis)
MMSSDAKGDRPTMRGQMERAAQIARIKSRIARDEYAVEPRKVADAMVARLLARQKACS